jgi:two-component system chemotaxis response regulator CheB
VSAAAACAVAPPASAQGPIRLVIVDDSHVARAVLTRMLSGFPDFEIVGTAANSAEAIALLPNVEADIVLLDVEMPGESGLEALPAIVRAGGGARVLIVSSFCDRGAEAAVRSLGGDIGETLPKPGADMPSERFSEILADRLRLMGRRGVRVVRPAPAIVPLPEIEVPIACVAIGASTGGLHAVTTLLAALPRQIGVPILVTQHLPAAFLPFFARQVEAAAGRQVEIARDDLPLRPDLVVLAPGDAHLRLVRGGSGVRVNLDRETGEGRYMPSVDAMLESAATAYGSGTAAIMLSGMGRDGLAGCRAVAAEGGFILVQDKASSAVWGMPRVVSEAGLAAAVLPPADIAIRVAERVGTPACR